MDDLLGRRGIRERVVGAAGPQQLKGWPVVGRVDTQHGASPVPPGSNEDGCYPGRFGACANDVDVGFDPVEIGGLVRSGNESHEAG